MTWIELLHLALGLAQLTLVAVLACKVGRYRKGFPWLLLIMVFSAVRGLSQLFEAASLEPPISYTLAVELVLLGVSLLLVLGIGRLIATVQAAESAARAREGEYARALRDYRVLVRHRIANPLAAVRGSIATLREVKLSDDDSQMLLDVLEQESERLQHVALDPLVAHPSEQRLSPQPAESSAPRTSTSPPAMRQLGLWLQRRRNARLSPRRRKARLRSS